MNGENGDHTNDNLVPSNDGKHALAKINFLHDSKDALAIQKHLKFMEQSLRNKKTSTPASEPTLPAFVIILLSLTCLAVVVFLPLQCLHKSSDGITTATAFDISASSNNSSWSASETTPNTGPHKESSLISDVPAFDGSHLIKGNGGDWRAATLVARQNYCKHVSVGLFLKNEEKIGWQFIFDSLQEFYTTDNQSLLDEKIIDVTVLTINASR